MVTMQPPPKPLCDLDDTWEDVLTAFQDCLKGESTWSCHCLAGVDKEVILSAPEIMDPKTDSGFSSETIYSLSHLLKTQEVPSAATVSTEAALLDVMDYIHVKELTYLKGYSLTQSYLDFPYFLRMDLLKEQNGTLYAYCRGVLRSLDCVLRAVFSTTNRSEEEFMLVPPELDRQPDCSVDEILAELETAAAKSSSPAVAARLRFRKHFLAALSLLLESKKRSDIEAACDICQEALDLLKSDQYTRSSEPAPETKLLRGKEIAFWVSVITPTKALPATSFADAMSAYKCLLQQLMSFKTLVNIESLACIADFIENFGALQPLLPVRSLCAIVLFSRDPNESFLHGAPLHRRMLETLAKRYGAPLYQRIFEADEAMIDGVVEYRVKCTMNRLKVTPEQRMFLRQQTVDSVRRWTTEVCKLYLVFLETMLCNRGLAHRRMINTMADFIRFQEMSYTTDLSVFLANLPGVAKELEAECIRCSTVLTLFSNDYVLRAMEIIMSFEVELDLLTQGELVPAMWYINFAQRAQKENLTTLCLQSTHFIPATLINKRTHIPIHNLALTTRTTGQMDLAHDGVLDARCSLSDATYLSACLMERKNLIDLISAPKGSLISVENAFNHRLLLCYGQLRNPPLRSYERCMSARPSLDDVRQIPMYAKKAAEVASNAAEKLKALMSSSAIDDVRKAAIRRNAEGLEKTAHVVAASLRAFSAVCENGEELKDYCATVERPGLPSALTFTFRRRKEISTV
ncbi:Mak10 subunit, NatC N(alpha)-terminal acetyltransferase, putative [Leishmania lindenbergi]|uniref:Mak10 subunit, NatC N(Alpha)-terminal acetyltransferase n=1 Tax=Leishmania lindenbergi TaxID=651832 RepID=A0AAW3AKX6_9TRYP